LNLPVLFFNAVIIRTHGGAKKLLNAFEVYPFKTENCKTKFAKWVQCNDVNTMKI